MASIKNGILGGFTGKIGNVVGYSSYGVDRMRSISDRTALATAAELRNRKQFKLVQDTLNCIKELVKIGFKNYWTKTGGIRGAVSYNKTRALELDGDDCTIDPERFRFSGGVLPGLLHAGFELEREDLLRFSSNPELVYGASPKDQVMLLAIDLEGKKASCESLGNFMGSGTDVLRFSNDLKGKTLDIYIAVVAKDRSKQSDSQYLGRVNIPDPDHDKMHKEETHIFQQMVETLTSEQQQAPTDSAQEYKALHTNAMNEQAYKLIPKTTDPDAVSDMFPKSNHTYVMKNHLLTICFLFLSSIAFAQNQQPKNSIDADKLSASQLAHMDRIAPKNGWVLVKYKGENYIRNFSNKDYVLSLSVKCSKSTQKPGYLIEYSSNYGDKEMGGIDFLSSSKMDFAKVRFHLDGKNFENPFSRAKNNNFSLFYQALKTAKILKIETFNNEFNPNTGKEELKLNRAIDFKLENAALLELPVNCK
ncbi:hypothetical protein DBR43_10765 [Pedobacter sp. KBW06]|uniref:DUF6266 family protein n=1 Tax=Pedobacter sp. KBW06 TaxID=2153359 RepID=UPI000F59BE85|nr:DUF6266 family protein [Pedobacter sp. KBW06]RQO71723.1 hypothetical protein DBR43_10765 [Pedobacter sp. KBW06]